MSMESKNAPKVIVRNRDRAVEITRSFTVEGAVDMPAQYSGKPFRPDMITVNIQDGKLYRVAVSGQRVLVRGALAQNRARKDWWSVAELEKDAPVWVRDAVVTVLQQEGAR